MVLTPNTAKYVDDRKKRIMSSLKKIKERNLTDKEEQSEIDTMLTWHIARTLSDMKSQISFVLKRKVPNEVQSPLIVERFNMRLLDYKSFKENEE